MSENLEESKEKEIDDKGQYVSVMIESGNKHSYINGIFLGESSEYFIVKDSRNKVFYIHKNKIICHIFEEK
ncbi:hypothetical protein IAI10_18195 [Clostridium sp. 19966]|uniref:hypothetical protein n=1 Tax=Clostridium sp. 19966 TaxID=2768166 RepID=UPI0028DD84B9|nr:hypothetical protein [Clostridium sp. 19966]MDT8718598.1 hypothetical protein [Clostridium sp. 19966]